MEKTAFNSEKYIKMQKIKIIERINNSNNKLYMEFGGKIFDDFHASRVLPGYKPNSKIKLLQSLNQISEIIICISAKDIENNKIRSDFGITYSKEILRLIDEFKNLSLSINSVVITQFRNQETVINLKTKLENNNIKVYLHHFIEGYPTDIEKILSKDGYGKNQYIETTKPLVIVTGPGPGSGKLATCMSQIYQDNQNKVSSKYCKFETFPVWNLPLNHPVNIAYEASTADLEDINIIDPYYLKKYNEIAVNYNRDIEIFPIIKSLLQNISDENVYDSPTEMGVNMVGYCIENDDEVSYASKQEVIRRYYNSICKDKNQNCNKKEIQRIEVLMNKLQISKLDRDVVTPTLNKFKETNAHAVSIKLHTGEIITGRSKDIMTAAASVVLNAIKKLSGLNDNILLISENILKPIQELKRNLSKEKHVLLDTNDILLALSICGVTNPTAKMAIDRLEELQFAEAHSTYILSGSEENIYRNLKINVTTEPNYMTNKLYME